MLQVLVVIAWTVLAICGYLMLSVVFGGTRSSSDTMTEE